MADEIVLTQRHLNVLSKFNPSSPSHYTQACAVSLIDDEEAMNELIAWGMLGWALDLRGQVLIVKDARSWHVQVTP